MSLILTTSRLTAAFFRNHRLSLDRRRAVSYYPEMLFQDNTLHEAADSYY
jgi:hypothetical protein